LRSIHVAAWLESCKKTSITAMQCLYGVHFVQEAAGAAGLMKTFHSFYPVHHKTFCLIMAILTAVNACHGMLHVVLR